MAHIIPSRIRSAATKGEKDLHSLLSKLPDNCVVYFEPNVNGRHPDFVVLSPELGVLIIEDKNWYPVTILSGDSSNIRIKGSDGAPTSVTHPELQARQYNERLRDLASQNRFSRIFLQPDGPHEGRLSFPVAHVVTLSNITDAQLHDSRQPLSDIFQKESTITKDQLEAWQSLSPTELLEAFRAYFDPWWSFPPLSAEQMKALRALIHPEIDFENRFSIDSLENAPRPIHDRQDVLKVLDLKQEECANAIGDGHRILYGVAGSGKTIILLTRARLLAAQNPDARILLLCFNRQLSQWMAQQVSDLRNVHVSTFHAWACRNGAGFHRDWSDETLGKRLIAKLDQDAPDAGRFDAILVDEAQDFEPIWFRCLLKALKDPENGDLMIVADGAQGLYRRSKIRWSHLGIKARGRSHSARFDLDQNYRNSTEILTLAETFATRTEVEGNGDDIDDGIQSVRVDPRRCVRSTGATPLLHLESTRENEMARVEEIVGDLLNGRWNGQKIGPLTPNEIAILYPRAFTNEKTLLGELKTSLSLRYRIPVQWQTGPAKEKSINSNALKIQTIHASKGLQYRAVIVLWADKMPFYPSDGTPRHEAESSDRRLLYVAMTRAESFLALTANAYRSSAFIQEIESTPATITLDHRETMTQAIYVG